MAVQFDGFNQSKSVHTCTASAFNTGFAYYKSGIVYGGGKGATPAATNTSLVIPASVTNTLCLWFIGSAQMYLQPDWMPATGVGDYDAKLNVVGVAPFGVTWESLTIMFGSISGCHPTSIVYQQSGLGIDVTTAGIKTHSFKAGFAQTWDSSAKRWYYCFGFGNTNGTNITLTVKYNQRMRYPRPGENLLGLGTGIIHRGHDEHVPLTAKAHAMVGQP